MRKDLFDNYVLNPASLPPASVAELKQLISEYPYFQTGQMLYLKSLHSNNSISYSDQLKITALYANDRSMLFRLIKMQANCGDQPAQANTASTKPGNSAIGPIQPPLPADSKLEQEISSPVTQPEFEQAAPEAGNQTIEENNTATDSLHSKESLNELIIRRLREIEEAKPAAEPVSVLQLQNNAAETEINKDSLLSFDYSGGADIEEDKEDKEAGAPKEAHLSSNKKHRFVLQSVEYVHNLEMKLASAGKDYFEIDSKHDDEGGEQSKLIDAFLEKQPRINPKRPLSSQPLVDISASSVEEPEILTETIAKIYANQQQFDKAVKIYEMLSLKYPQKSIYFADQIRKLKESTGKHNI
jgi:hypothetical protein